VHILVPILICRMAVIHTSYEFSFKFDPEIQNCFLLLSPSMSIAHANEGLDAILDAELDAWEQEGDSKAQSCSRTPSETLDSPPEVEYTPFVTEEPISDHVSCRPSLNRRSRKPTHEDLEATISNILHGMSLASTTAVQLQEQDVEQKKTRKCIDSSSKSFENSWPVEQEAMMQHMMKEFEANVSSRSDYDNVMDGMMKQLLGKELMYEPMKSVCDLFPKWLAEHKDRCTHDEYYR